MLLKSKKKSRFFSVRLFLFCFVLFVLFLFFCLFVFVVFFVLFFVFVFLFLFLSKTIGSTNYLLLETILGFEDSEV